jgi:hypothetical protein
VLVDPRATASLKKAGQGKTEYLVYAENVSTAELARILQQLAESPKNQPAAAQAKRQESTFETLVVTSLTDADRQQLSGLFGVDAAEFSPRRRGDGKRRDAGLFEQKIIEAPRDRAAEPAPQWPASDRFAVVLAAAAGATASDEAKAFLASRRQQRPGAVQVLLVIRQA